MTVHDVVVDDNDNDLTCVLWIRCLLVCSAAAEDAIVDSSS